jgi:tetratricopeptide (TPR) repeat protein
MRFLKLLFLFFSYLVILLIGFSFAYAETAEEYYLRTGKAYISKEGKFTQVTAVKQTGIAQAGSDYTKAAGEYNRKGIADAKQGNRALAIQDFSKAIELVPNYAQAYHNRGLVYFSQGNFGQAIWEFSRAIELDPDYAPVYYDRALAYATQNNFPQVISDCTKAIEMNPKFGEAYSTRASAYSITKQHDKALTDIYMAKAMGATVDPALIRQLEQEQVSKADGKAEEEKK